MCIKVIILADGTGAMLWPLSRNRYPKQFIKFQNQEHSLFQETFNRSLLIADLDDIYVVTNKNYKFLVMGAVEELGHKYREENILVEPEAKNTLPAIYAGVHEIVKEGHDLVIVFPSDHIIKKDKKLVELIKVSEGLTKDSLITFGIKPDGPHTGYGYISPGDVKGNGYVVKEFKEKPDYQTAVQYIRNGYYWNSGIFMFDTRIFIEEVKTYVSEIFNAFQDCKTLEEAFAKIKINISIDYGIMENSNRVVVVPADIDWNDLGSFDSFYVAFDKNEGNNIAEKNYLLLDSNNTIIHSEDGKLVVTVGIDNVIIIDTKDALLVCKKGQSQKVQEVVALLKEKGDIRTDYHLQDYRPWGSYTILEEEKNTFKVKRIKVNPKEKLSYQLHRHRSEHWIIVQGVAKVTLDDEVKILQCGENIFVHAKQKHRIENPGKMPLEFIEVQIGNYLEEDDIVRFEDEYGRK